MPIALGTQASIKIGLDHLTNAFLRLEKRLIKNDGSNGLNGSNLTGLWGEQAGGKTDKP